MSSDSNAEESVRDYFVFGTSELAQLTCHYLNSHPSQRVVAATVDRDYLGDATTAQLPVPLIALEDAREVHPGTTDVVVAIGYQRVNRIRRDISLRLEQERLRICSFVHPSATIGEGVPVGPGSILLEQVVVQPFAALGRGVVCWSGSVVSHHALVGDWCYLAPGAVVSGNVSLGEGVFIGSNATIRDGVTVGDHAVIGAGALVTRDVPARAVVPGGWNQPDGRDSLQLPHL